MLLLTGPAVLVSAVGFWCTPSWSSPPPYANQERRPVGQDKDK